jgi:membrane protease YdiL (CAAX protease family)
MLFALYSKSFSLSGVSSTFLAAASEELVFRGIIFPCLLLLFVKSDQRILNSIVICSILFGSIHLLHMFRHPEQWIGIVLQSLGAFSLSMVLCYSMIKSSNIILVTFFHFAVNLFLKNAERSNNPIGYESNIENFSFDLAGLAFTIGIIVLVNAYLVAKMNTLDKTDYDIKLNHSIT